MLPLTLLMARQAYRLERDKPLGRHSAGAGFLEAYLRYGGNATHQVVVPTEADAQWFHAQAQHWNAQAQTQARLLAQWGDAAQVTGAIHLPGPGLDEWAWKRMPWGDQAFSLVGLVHTLCSRPVQWGLGQFATAPVRPWDALICTSTAAKAVVEGFLERQEAWLRERVGGTRFERPQLPVIPLGIHPEVWQPPEGKRAAQAMSRRHLGLDPNALIVLLAGRLDLLTKSHPEPLLRVLASLQRSSHPQLQLLIYGEAPNAAMDALCRQGVQEVAPDLQVHWIEGRDLELAAPVRWAADVFVSLADNPQETFGITPLEAMAAELPCVVSDWDGYRDTVRDPNEAADGCGFRVATRMVEGLGREEAQGLLQETLAYDQAVGQQAQGIAIDLGDLREKLVCLLNSGDLRSKLGQQARERVERLYAWPVVIQQWRDLLQDLAQRRPQQATAGALPPWMQPSSEAFAAFATEVLPEDWMPSPLPNREDELRRHEGCLQRWDHTLVNEQSNNGSPSARRRGWWLKQGLANR